MPCCKRDAVNHAAFGSDGEKTPTKGFSGVRSAESVETRLSQVRSPSPRPFRPPRRTSASKLHSVRRACSRWWISILSVMPKWAILMTAESLQREFLSVSQTTPLKPNHGHVRGNPAIVSPSSLSRVRSSSAWDSTSTGARCANMGVT